MLVLVIKSRTIERLLSFLFNILDKLFFKKEYIVFSTRSAKAYADNSKVLFEALLSKNPQKTFFFTKKKKILATIPKNGIYAYSPKGLYILLKSKLLVFTHGKFDFFPYLPRPHSQRTFLNLFHAIAVKKLADKASFSASKKKDIDSWDYFLVSSQFEKEFIKKQFGFDEKQMLSFGQPRNDIIVKNKLQPSSNSKKVVLYAPTFRDHTMTMLFPFEDANLLALDKFLGENSIEIMIRLHVHDEQKYSKRKIFKALKNIYFKGSDKIPSVNDYLHNVDMLISDYSSIVLDYLLLDRPIAYIPYDYDEYNEVRGFSFDYFKHLAGPVLQSQSDLQSFLLSDGEEHAEQRKSITTIFHQHQDGESTQRLIQFIESI